VRIALLEDDPAQARVMQEWLTAAGHACHVYDTSRPLLATLRRESFDLLVLDWQVPDLSGIEVLRRVRADLDTRVPVLFVTSRDAERDIVEALEAGADDYLVKPPRRLELLSRLHALWRRASGTEGEPKVLDHPPYRLDFAERRAYRAGSPVDLTPKEFEVAWLLFRQLGRLTSRGHLLESVWGHGTEVTTRTVDSHVSRMRAKLDLKPERGFRLVSVYGYGYRLELAGAS
jgi:two-component system, OmpR family, response regulator RegX3